MTGRVAGSQSVLRGNGSTNYERLSGCSDLGDPDPTAHAEVGALSR